MARDDFMTAATNRSIRSIKAELAFLADASVMSPEQLQSILSQLPSETGLHAPIPLQTVPAAQLSNLSVNDSTKSNGYNEKQNGFSPSPNIQPASPQPPAYPIPPQPPQQSALTYATALYAYAPTDAGDLALQANDRIAVTEYMNAEWWKGKSERTGQEGIFPRSYVKIDEKDMPPQPTSYGNMPLEVSQGQGATPVPGQPGKFEQNGKKFGKKLGNAAIFGAGASIGGNIVNSIF